MTKTKTPNPHAPNNHAENFHGDMRKGAYLRRQAAYHSETTGRNTRSSRKPPR
jgi:hypothetical protein